MSTTLDEILIRGNKATYDTVINFWKEHFLSGTPINEQKAIATFKKMFDDCEDTNFMIAQSPYALQKECNRASVQYLGEANTALDDYQDTLYIKSMSDTIGRLTGGLFGLVENEIDKEFHGRSAMGHSIHANRQVTFENPMSDIAYENCVNNVEVQHINYIDFNSIVALDFLSKIGIINDESINLLIDFALTGVYGITMFGTEKVVMLPLPLVSLNEDNKLSANDKFAITFSDGYGLAFWKGLRIPNKFIAEPITKDVIMSINNAELKRSIKEMIGNDKFIQLLDLECIGEDFDEQQNIMRLMKSKHKDPAIFITDEADGHLYFLHVVCPSTKREYYLSVRPTTDVWKAKRSLFRNFPIKYRHGDVGLLDRNKSYQFPIQET